MNTCPNCGMVKGIHASILPGCKCRWTPQETDCYGDGNVYRGARSRDSFKPDWNTEAVLVEEMQRMAKRIEELEATEERNPRYQKIAPLYISPPAQRTWVGLTDEEIDSFREANSEGRGAGWRFNFKGFARAIEAKLKEKNT